jgi:hypothetical protein
MNNTRTNIASQTGTLPSRGDAQHCVRSREASRMEPQVCLGCHPVTELVVLLVVPPHEHLPITTSINASLSRV